MFQSSLEHKLIKEKHQHGSSGSTSHSNSVIEDTDNILGGTGYQAVVEEGPDSSNNSDDSSACEPTHTRLVRYCALCSSLVSMGLGYDVGVMSGAILYIATDLDLSIVQQEFIVGSLNLIAAFGGLIAGKLSDKLGRKKAISFACVVFVIGAIIMACAQDFQTLLIGRIITGTGVGCGFVVAPVYITEITPPEIRGQLVSLTDVSINVGILVGYIVAYVCETIISNDGMKWRLMLGLSAVAPIAIILSLSTLPESPRWLINKGRDHEGLQVLKLIMSDEREALESLRLIQNSANRAPGIKYKDSSWLDILCPKDPIIKAAMFVGLGLGFWQQASGSEAAVYYSPIILDEAGFTSRGSLLAATCLIGSFKVGGELIAMSLLDRVGRRPLFILSSVLCTISLAIVATALTYNWNAALTLAGICNFMLCFSLGLGPLTFVVAAEIFPVQVRGKAVSCVVFVNRALSGIIALSFLSLSEALSVGGAFYLFMSCAAISVFFYVFCVPETMGKTLEEISNELAEEFHLPPVHYMDGQMVNYRTLPSDAMLQSSMSSDRLVISLGAEDVTNSPRHRVRSASVQALF